MKATYVVVSDGRFNTGIFTSFGRSVSSPKGTDGRPTRSTHHLESLRTVSELDTIQLTC
eukprot:m.493759 g.493759  ORF g.493759 m.493759 type:complete len:59 (-) comp120810_c0_seq1:24-200(-)